MFEGCADNTLGNSGEPLSPGEQCELINEDIETVEGEIIEVNFGINKADLKKMSLTYTISIADTLSSNEQEFYVKHIYKKWIMSLINHIDEFEKISYNLQVSIMNYALKLDYELLLQNLNKFSKLTLEDEYLLIEYAKENNHIRELKQNINSFRNIMSSPEHKLVVIELINSEMKKDTYKIIKFKKRT